MNKSIVVVGYFILLIFSIPATWLALGAFILAWGLISGPHWISIVAAVALIIFGLSILVRIGDEIANIS